MEAWNSFVAIGAFVSFILFIVKMIGGVVGAVGEMKEIWSDSSPAPAMSNRSNMSAEELYDMDEDGFMAGNMAVNAIFGQDNQAQFRNFMDQTNWEQQHFMDEMNQQQFQQFMNDSMQFGMDSVTPFEHGGFDMNEGNSFNMDFGGGFGDFGGGFGMF